MGSKEAKKLPESVEQLQKALKLYQAKKGDAKLNMLLVVKAFEVAVEYAWRELKRRVEDEGIDAPSPKEAVRAAARLSFIRNPDKWIECINARNGSVHDYFGISEQAYVTLAKDFVKMANAMHG